MPFVEKPMEEKYRTIKKSNPAFSRRLGSLPGGSDLLLAAGFVVDANDGVEYYVLHPSEEAWPRLVAAREGARRALGEHESGGGSVGTAASSGVPGSVGAGTTGAGSAAPFGGMSNMFPAAAGGGAPDMAAMQGMLSDVSVIAQRRSVRVLCLRHFVRASHFLMRILARFEAEHGAERDERYECECGRCETCMEEELIILGERIMQWGGGSLFLQ